MIKTALEDDDLITIGTKDAKYDGGYKPTAIKYSDLASQLNAGEVESVTDDGNGVVSVDNADPANPVIEFNGVNTDGVTITGDGSAGSPLVASPVVIGVQSVTGLNTDNSDPLNPITQISVDGTTITGLGTPASPLVAAAIGNANFGLFAQTGNSVPISGTNVETTLINGGVGSLSVPANGFQVGDSFRAIFGGVLNAANNQTIRIRVKSGSVILLDSGLQPITNITNNVFNLHIDFTIRALGTAGVASIVALGAFNYVKTSNGVIEGFGFNTVNSTTFNTTIGNTLDVTVQWGSNNAGNSIFSDIFILNKTY